MPKILGERLRVLYPTGQLAYRVTPAEARQLIRARLAEPVGNRTKIWAIQLCEGPARPVAGTKYSFKAETEDNPPNVWALREILHIDRGLFTQVQTDCLA